MRGGRGGSKRDCEGYGPAMDMKFGTQYGIHKESIHAKNQLYPIIPWYLTTVSPLKIKEMNPTGYTWLEALGFSMYHHQTHNILQLQFYKFRTNLNYVLRDVNIETHVGVTSMHGIWLKFWVTRGLICHTCTPNFHSDGLSIKTTPLSMLSAPPVTQLPCIQIVCTLM